jgi:hypothetical protein
VRKKEEWEGNKEKGKREKENGEKKKKYERVIWTSHTSIQEVKPFCQTFSKMTPAPSEKPLHQRSRSRSRSRFWSRSPAKQTLSRTTSSSRAQCRTYQSLVYPLKKRAWWSHLSPTARLHTHTPTSRRVGLPHQRSLEPSRTPIQRPRPAGPPLPNVLDPTTSSIKPPFPSPPSSPLVSRSRKKSAPTRIEPSSISPQPAAAIVRIFLVGGFLSS